MAYHYTLKQCSDFGPIEKVSSLRLSKGHLIGNIHYKGNVANNLYTYLDKDAYILWNKRQLELQHIRLNNIPEFYEAELLPDNFHYVYNKEQLRYKQVLASYLSSVADKYSRIENNLVFKVAIRPIDTDFVGWTEKQLKMCYQQAYKFIFIPSSQYLNFRPNENSNRYECIVRVMKNFILKEVMSDPDTEIGIFIKYKGVEHLPKTLYRDNELIDKAVRYVIDQKIDLSVI